MFVKEYALVIVLLLSWSVIIAQPVITDAITPEIGDKIEGRLPDVTGFTPGDAGENITWDFSNLDDAVVLNFEILDPENLPSSELFSEADFVWNIKEFELYQYYENRPDGIDVLGSGSTISDDEYDFIVFNTDVEDALQFPITYNSSYSYSTMYDNYLFGSKVFSGARTGQVTADAYGTIITPLGRYTDVLRLKIVTQSFGFTSTQYAWMHPMSFFPVLVYEFSDDPDEESSLYYADINGVISSNQETQVSDNGSFQLIAKPESLELVFSESTDLADVHFSLYDMTGRLVQNWHVDQSRVMYERYTLKLNQRVSIGQYVFKYTTGEPGRSQPKVFLIH